MKFGPYAFGQNDELGSNGGLPSPFESGLKVGSLTIDYNAHFALVKLIASEVKDVTRGFATGNFLSSAVPVGAGQCPTCAPGYQPVGGVSLYSLDPDAFYTFPSDAERRGNIEELRFTSPDANSALTWVGGLYYSHFVAMTEASNGINETTTEAGADTAYESLFGPTWNAQSTLGVENGAKTLIPWNSTPGIPPGVVMQRFQNQRDVEEAAYGDLNYDIAHKLTVTGGLRVSHDYFQYNQEAWGMEAGYYPTPYGNSNYVHGTQVANPPTPRGVISYQINSDDMVYVSASKGYREGGVNSTLVSGQCTPALALLGFTPNDFPTTYRPDSLWSYEAGPKLRLFNDTLQINASAYFIDWNDIQTSVTVPGCAIAYVTNAGKAESNGFDLQVQQAVGQLVLSASLGYDNAFYTKAAAGPKSTAGVVSPVVLPGSPLPIPPWQLTAGVNYNFRITANYAGYLQVEDYWQSSYINGTAPGTTSYSPDTRNLPGTNRVDLRVGTTFGRWDWSLYANNLLDARDVLTKGGGRSGCPISEGAACTTPTSYNPLLTETLMPPITVGLTALFKL
jgi:outer membrane receptor protein involved in Fe transport